jgi:hypothetical protein
MLTQCKMLEVFSIYLHLLLIIFISNYYEFLKIKFDYSSN